MKKSEEKNNKEQQQNRKTYLWRERRKISFTKCMN
jgi:hypothetical protein